MNFCIIDASNLIHRIKHGVETKPVKSSVFDPWGENEDNQVSRKGLIFHSVFNNILYSFQKFNSNHLVMAFDHRSWRKDFYDEYKANRHDRILTPDEEKDRELIQELINELKTFLSKNTNITVLQVPDAEADDVISRWIQLHDDSCFNHAIISNDGDFKQLISDNVVLYNPLSRVLYTIDGVYFQKGRDKKFKSSGEIKLYNEDWQIKEDKNGDPETIEPEWELFYKCIRGDSTDNISSAYPRISTKKMKSAFHGNIEEWNNFINSFWGDGEENSVRELYERNKKLIDLKEQPDYILNKIDKTIFESLSNSRVNLIGAKFKGFCSKYNLEILSNKTENFTEIFSAGY